MKKKIALILAIVMLISLIPNSINNGFKYTDISEVHAEGQANGSAVVEMARNYIGHMTYISGGMDLSVGCDCSGFVCAVYRLCGMDLVDKGVRSTYDMMDKAGNIHATVIQPATKADVRNGDLVITNGGGHVGIGTDSGHMIHQTNSAINEVREVDLDDYSSPIVMIVRIDYTQWGGSNASNLSNDSNQNSDTNNNNNEQKEEVKKVDDKDNPGFPYAVPATAVSFGSNSNATMWLQTGLNKLNSAGLEVDGSFGRLSESAVKDFQSKYGLEANGVADSATIDKMVDVHKALYGVEKIEVVAEDDKKTGNEGDLIKLSTKITPEVSVSVPITWTSSNGDVATVDENGNVSLKGEGLVGIVATAPNGVTGTITITSNGNPHYNEWHNGRWFGADGTSTYEYPGEWKQDVNGWWFEDTSGWYPKNEWVKMDGSWYYFNGNGYNARSGWTKVNGTWYYFKKTGEMAANEWMDGYWLSADGSWNYKGVANWKMDVIGWWYEDSLGWYPQDQTVTINGDDYYFDSLGYWIQNHTEESQETTE